LTCCSLESSGMKSPGWKRRHSSPQRKTPLLRRTSFPNLGETRCFSFSGSGSTSVFPTTNVNVSRQ
jgi:hypothetical protein